MMNERRRKLQTVKVDHYDGQAIYSGNELVYELGGYLGGGAAGVVYEAFSTRTKQHVAIKILNPVGYKLFPSTLLARCIVAVKGKPLVALPVDDAYENSHFPGAERRPYASGNHRMRSSFGSSRTAFERICIENVWWLIHPTSKQAIAAFEDPHTGVIRELTLPQCIDVWGEQLNQQDSGGKQQTDPAELYQEVQVKNQSIKIPRIPKKFIKFAHTRRSIHREISNMSGLEPHKNVLRLDEALELVQDSKCTTFLVLELAGGGELFDRIKLDCGTDEDTARLYFFQLISGVAFCHTSGICHRDLKPENLLLADNEEPSTLKIADFGLSAIFSFTESDENPNGNGADHPQSIRRLRSVVGSPHYVAPEVLMDAGQGYDGAKADAWSIGVILYAMIAGNLPFGKDLLKCLRYDRFRKWSYNTKYSDDDPTNEVEFPTWFFPTHFSLEAKSLIAQLLYPDACMRMGVGEALQHPWVRGEELKRSTPVSTLEDERPPSNATPASPMGFSTSPSTPLVSKASYKHRMNVVVNVPQNPVEVDQQLLSNRLGSASPQTIPRLHMSPRCPPSPQQSLRVIKHSASGVGYMPSVDETSTMSGQTPPGSPRRTRNSSSSNLESDTTSPVNSEVESTKELPVDTEISESDTHLKQEALVRVATMAASVELAENKTESDVSDYEDECEGGRGDADTSVSSAISLEAQEVTTQRCQPTFVSPPLATGSRSAMRSHFRRNSPPELFLECFDRGARLREITNDSSSDSNSTANRLVFERFKLVCRSPPLVPQVSDSADGVHSVPITRTSTEPLVLYEKMTANAAENGTETEGRGTEEQQDGALSSPPSYSDLVTRSTKFLTALPARLVLSNIEAVLQENPSPLPEYANSSIPQRVTIDWEKHQLEVRYAGLLTCTVQVFLFQRGVYLVEFRRGQIDFFQFKRFFEEIRAEISESMEGPPESVHSFRKRNKSISQAF